MHDFGTIFFFICVLLIVILVCFGSNIWYDINTHIVYIYTIYTYT